MREQMSAGKNETRVKDPVFQTNQRRGSSYSQPEFIGIGRDFAYLLYFLIFDF